MSPTLEIGYYTYAPVLLAAETHWMLDLMPYAIIDMATSRIFQMAGDETSAKFYNGTAMELFLTARRDFQDQSSNSAT